MSKCRIPLAVLLVAAAVSGCDKPAPPASQARPVRTVTVEQRAGGEIVSLTGQVRAKDQASLAFRLDGRMIERPVNVGDVRRGRPSRRPARPADPAELVALGASQPLVGRGAAERGADHLLARAGAVEERLDVPCQIRQGPAHLRDASGPGRRRAGTGAHRAGAAELHGLVSRCPRCGHRGRRRTGRSGPCRGNDCPGRACRAGATPSSTSPNS